MSNDLLSAEFRALSARLGNDALQVQAAGGNTSVKNDQMMWIKASGTKLADAMNKDIFVAVNLAAAINEAKGLTGDGSCQTTLLDDTFSLRPSIETTFHAVLNHAVVAHTHSIATLVHMISPEGREAAREKLADLPFAIVPYAKPGLALTQEIMAANTGKVQIFLLANHGLICCGATFAAVSDLINEVERRLMMPTIHDTTVHRKPDEVIAAPKDYIYSAHDWMALHPRTAELVGAGSYYPDHVVFLGQGLPDYHPTIEAPAVMVAGRGVALRAGASEAQQAMLRCLADVFERLPEHWSIEPLGLAAEAELLNWDAEKYRQSLARVDC